MISIPRGIDPHVGFTGSRNGLTMAQLNVLRPLLVAFMAGVDGYAWFHHGDCVGADAAAHDVAVELGYKIWGHPPINSKHRAWCKFDASDPEREYHDRNRRIVNGSRLLIATPDSPTYRERGGTWSTWKYAQSRRMNLLITPDGNIALGFPKEAPDGR